MPDSYSPWRKRSDGLTESPRGRISVSCWHYENPHQMLRQSLYIYIWKELKELIKDSRLGVFSEGKHNLHLRQHPHINSTHAF